MTNSSSKPLPDKLMTTQSTAQVRQRLEYLTFETHRNPDMLAERFRGLVHQHKLGDRILRFCLQKGASKQQGYWAFLAVQPGAELPEVFYRFLADLNIRLKKDTLQEKDIAKMLAHRYISLDRPDPVLAYAKPVRHYDMSFGEEQHLQASQRSHSLNQLLCWLSASQAGSWSGLRAVSETLGLSKTPAEARYLMRSLYLLGHLEVAADGSRWEIAPAAWVETDTQGEWFLAGSRAAADRDQYVCSPQPQEQGPERWTSHKLHEDAPVAGNVARELVMHLPSLAGWKETLAVKTMDELVHYQFERWNGSNFEPMDHHRISETGLYRVTPQSQRFVRQYQLYYDAPAQRWLQADWSGLRLLADFEQGAEIEWIYRPEAQVLCLRADQRPPLIYERALVLASGSLPRESKGWLHYGCIGETLAQFLAQQLSAQITKES